MDDKTLRSLILVQLKRRKNQGAASITIEALASLVGEDREEVRRLLNDFELRKKIEWLPRDRIRLR